jgi:glycosyltransferase involved in cell wall biosynthesis
MSDVAFVAFSRDRPLQLDATLRSFKRHALDVNEVDLHVLYRATSGYLDALYQELGAAHPSVVLHRETDFARDVMRIVDSFPFVMFGVDDTVFTRDFSLSVLIRQLEARPDCIGVSLRLGRNTTSCYPFRAPQAVPEFTPTDSGLLAFNWVDAEYDFGYPLELSSSIYRTQDVIGPIAAYAGSSPNTLEAALADHARTLAGLRPVLSCYAESRAFSIPANRVQDVIPNRVAEDPRQSIPQLARDFEMGRRIDIIALDGFPNTACHQEVTYRLISPERPHPTVSVIVPCFRQAEYLEESLESVVAQTFSDWELIVVDDGSPDDAAGVARRFIEGHPQLRMRLIRQANLGLPAARNSGIRASEGRFILPLDADDRLMPEMLERTVAALEADHSASIAYTDQRKFGAVDEVLRLRTFTVPALRHSNIFAYCSLYRRGVWDAVGGYNTDMTVGYEDWDFWIAAASRGFTAVRVAEPLFCYRVKEVSLYTAARAQHDQLVKQVMDNHPTFFLPHRSPTGAGSSNSTPLVSILTPTFNHGLYIEQCIASVISQTEQRWEQIIIDDGSTDDTGDLIGTFDDPRIRYIRQERQGISALARTYDRALQMARGEFVAILEGDDFWPVDKLERQLPSFERDEVVLSWGFAHETDEAGAPQQVFPPGRVLRRLQGRRPRSTLDALLAGNYIPACTVICRRAALEKIGGFWQPFDVPTADYPTWLLLCRMGSFAPITAVLGFWRRHDFQVTVQLASAMQRVPTLDWASELAAQLTVSEQRDFGLTPPELQRRRMNRDAAAAFVEGRAAMAAGQRNTARLALKQAVRIGIGSVRAKALIALACTTIGLDIEWLIALRDRIRDFRTGRLAVPTEPATHRE